MVAELADALALGASVRKDVWVRLPPMAPFVGQAGAPALGAGIRKDVRVRVSPSAPKFDNPRKAGLADFDEERREVYPE